MIDLLQDRLSRVSDLNDRRLLKNILNDVYSGLIEYNMEMYDRLEQRIYNEIDDPLNRFYIYTCLEKVDNVDPVDSFLFPIIPADLEDAVYDMDEINEKIHSGLPVSLASVFMKCDTKTLLEILRHNRRYKGYLKTDKDIHEVYVTLSPCKKYMNEIEKLYRIFQFNKVPWSTVNCPYAYKFVDVLMQVPPIFKEGEKIKEISIDLAEFDKYKEINVVPLWNIRPLIGDDKAFPMPARDRINRDHIISLEEPGIQHGYLLAEDYDFLYCKRYPEDLVIVSPNDKQRSWNLLQITSRPGSAVLPSAKPASPTDVFPVRSGENRYSYEIMSNKRKLGFIGRYAATQSMVVRTTGELSRLLESYELSGQLHFQKVEIIDRYEKDVETVDFNSFVDDNIRVDAAKKIMLIKFKPDNREDYSVYDKMSFLISEIQILFPEYKCIGEMV